MTEIELIKKIHDGSDETCYAAVLKNWNEYSDSCWNQMEKVFDLYSENIDESMIASSMGISLKEVKKYLQQYQKACCSTVITNDSRMYDKLYSTKCFYEQCSDHIKHKEKDTYFSLNSFYKPEKSGSSIRHINAFVLDFDFYKIDKYKDMSPVNFYERKIRKKLPFPPTAVIDSGRGLYVIYAFKNCSYHMSKLYKSIMNQFYESFKELGVDRMAMNLTQVIRLPGTINSKSGTRVKLLETNDTNLTIQDLASLLKWDAEEVKQYRINQIKDPIKQKSANKDISKRKPYFDNFYEDLKRLITIRNRKHQYEGYRETLIYLLRERATWSGYKISESVVMATELNKLFHRCLSQEDIEHTCKPSEGRKNTSYDTMIDKLSIDIDEQKQMNVLQRKWLKKALYSKRKRKIKLLNKTQKKLDILERRTTVCELKNKKHYTNSRISKILNVNKSTITRDLAYIKQNPSEFKVKLKEYMDALELHIHTDDFTKRTIFKRQKQLLKWLETGYTALDFLVRDIGVAEI